MAFRMSRTINHKGYPSNIVEHTVYIPVCAKYCSQQQQKSIGVSYVALSRFIGKFMFCRAGKSEVGMGRRLPTAGQTLMGMSNYGRQMVKIDGRQHLG